MHFEKMGAGLLVFICLLGSVSCAALEGNLFDNEFNHGSGGVIQSVTVIGERCSGTNYVRTLVGQNFPSCSLDLLHEKFPFLLHKHFYPWVDLTAFHVCKKGKKNENSPLVFLKNSDTNLFVLVVRDPYDWLRSFYLQPYHVSDQLSGKGFLHFIQNQWIPDSNLETIGNCKDWLNPYEGRPFKHVLELRKYKILNFLQIGLLVDNFLIVQHEKVSEFPEQFIDFVSRYFKLEKTVPFQPVKAYKGWGEERYRKKQYFPFNSNEFYFINEGVDWGIENLIGYSKINDPKEVTYDMDSRGFPDAYMLARKLGHKQRDALELFKRFETVGSTQIGELFNFTAIESAEICKTWLANGFLEVVDSSAEESTYKLSKEYESLGKAALESSSEELQKTKGYVSVCLVGQLGDQFFQIATAYAYALDHNLSLTIPDLLHKDQFNILYNAKKLFLGKIDTYDLPYSVPLEWWREPSFNYSEIPSVNARGLFGYFASEKYFKHRRKELLELFAPPSSLNEEILAKYPFLASDSPTVGVHIRDYRKEKPNGDYHPTLGRDYYKKAMEIFSKDTIFLVSSDNPDYAKECTQGLSENIIYLQGKDDIEELYTLVQCKSFIISNSSFGWWASWLSKESNKTVIGPYPWFSAPYDYEMMQKDLLPPEYKVIDYRNSEILMSSE